MVQLGSQIKGINFFFYHYWNTNVALRISSMRCKSSEGWVLGYMINPFNKLLPRGFISMYVKYNSVKSEYSEFTNSARGLKKK